MKSSNRILNIFCLALVAALSISAAASAQGVLFVTGGMVGIGTDTPTAPLDVNIGTDTPGAGNSVVRLERVGDLAFQLMNTNDGAFWNFSNAVAGAEFRISKSGTGATEMKLTTGGDLTITGSLFTSDCAPCVADYVFEPGYERMSLAELETFVIENKHLPNVPSQADVDRAGRLDMTMMQMRMLEKIEELTLYTIEQQKVIEDLQGRLEAVEKG